jgi:membrane-associated phospholipid phosphatase
MDIVLTLVATKAHYIVVFVAVIVFFRLDYVNKKSLAVLSIISLPTVYFFGKLLGNLIESPRPFAIHDVLPLFYHVADNGFPSEHALLSTAIAALVYTVQKPIGLLLLALSILIGSARVFANVHHSIDIIGGVLIALIVVISCHQLVRFLSISSNSKI